MCLWIHKKATEQFRQKMIDNGGSLTVYKQYRIVPVKGAVGEFKIMAFWQNRLAVIDENDFVWSNRRSAKLTKEEVTMPRVNKGIHTYVSKVGVLDPVPVLVHIDDFVAADGHEKTTEVHAKKYPWVTSYKHTVVVTQAVFLKVRFTEESFKALDKVVEQDNRFNKRSLKQDRRDVNANIKRLERQLRQCQDERDDIDQQLVTVSIVPRYQFRSR